MAYKMHERFGCLLCFALLTIVIWIYTSAKNDFHVTLKIAQIINIESNRFKQILFNEPRNVTCEDAPFIIIIVTSYVGHVELRSSHRRAMPVEYLNKFKAARVFLLARIPSHEKSISQPAIDDENLIYGDIIQGTFTENYRNLTQKHLMGLDWASKQCRLAKYILKVDDDTVFNLENTYNLLQDIEKNKIERNSFLIGYMLNNTKPRRMKQNKWYVTLEEYSRSIYPPYVSGWYYVTTPETARRLCEEANHHPYFWIDDILITGIITESLKIKLTHLPKNYWLEYYELLECCLRDMVRKYIQCDYSVGPNGGRNNLIYEYNSAYFNCQKWKNCTKRTEEHNLNNNCVNFKDRTIFSDGIPHVDVIKLIYEN